MAIETAQQAIERINAGRKTFQPLFKETEGKPDFTLVPTGILYEIEKVRQYGCKKYGDRDGWKQVNPKEYEKALYRHVINLLRGQENDEESGLSHLAHISCNVAFLIELKNEKRG